MKFEPSLEKGVFQKRYKRFFVDIDHNGQTLTAHCPNTGSLMGLKEPGLPCLFSTSDDPQRKLKQTLQMIKAEKSWVGVNTGLPNKLVVELFEKNPLKAWTKFNSYQSEVKINQQSRIDLVLWNSEDHPEIKKWNHDNLKAPLHLIEIKNVTLAQDDVALFPDAVTSRGAKHLDELIHFKKKGFTCEMVFVVQRMDCVRFKPAKEIDPEYCKKLIEAHKAGVQLTVLPCEMSEFEINLKASPLVCDLS